MSNWNPEANEIFSNAGELPAGEVRTWFLEQACRANLQLRADVETLLAADSRSEDFLERSPHLLLERQTPIAKPGDAIGRYTLLEQLGEGGMGGRVPRDAVRASAADRGAQAQQSRLWTGRVVV